MTVEPLNREEDDGRVICSMDVEGMPWHDRRARQRGLRDAASRALPGEQMTAAETRRYIWNAVLAGLTIAAVFSLTWVLFILFCIHVWFK